MGVCHVDLRQCVKILRPMILRIDPWDAPLGTDAHLELRQAKKIKVQMAGIVPLETMVETPG